MPMIQSAEPETAPAGIPTVGTVNALQYCGCKTKCKSGVGNRKCCVNMFEEQVVLLKSYTAALDEPPRCEKN